MTDIFVYTSNRKDSTAVSIDYDLFVDLVNQFFTKDYINDDNDYLQFKRNVKRSSTTLTTDNVKSVKRQQNAFKLVRNKSVLLDRALRAKLNSENIDYMDEVGFYYPQATGILGFNYHLDSQNHDDVEINTRLSITVDIDDVGSFVTEFEALVKKYNIADDISENTNVEITDTQLENCFAV